MQLSHLNELAELNDPKNLGEAILTRLRSAANADYLDIAKADFDLLDVQVQRFEQLVQSEMSGGHKEPEPRERLGSMCFTLALALIEFREAALVRAETGLAPKRFARLMRLLDLSVECCSIELGRQARITRAILLAKLGKMSKAIFELRRLAPADGKPSATRSTALDTLHWIYSERADSLENKAELQRIALQRANAHLQMLKESREGDEATHWAERLALAARLLPADKRDKFQSAIDAQNDRSSPPLEKTLSPRG